MQFQKICSSRGWNSGSAQYKKTYDSMLQIWDGLRQRADSNKDGQVTRNSYVSYFQIKNADFSSLTQEKITTI